MEVQGKVHEVGTTTQATETLRKRELILEIVENPQYPEYVKFEAIQDRCDLLNGLKVGQDVEVYFNLKGRPWTDKTGKKSYFNSLQLWKVNVLGEIAPKVVEISSGPDDDDLPF